MCLLTAFSGIDERSCSYFCCTGKHAPHNPKYPLLQTRPFPHYFGDDPARVHVIDDNTAFFLRCALELSNFLNAVDLYELGDVVSIEQR